MSWALAVGAAISGGVAVYKGVKGSQQTKAANDLIANAPGYQMNQNVLDNAKTVSDYYGNYNLPGYSQDVNNINSTFNGGFTTGARGATSGSDIQDLATRMAYGKNQAFNQLGQETALGKNAALGGYLQANAAAGEEYQKKNEFENQRYQQLLRNKAALVQAGAQNTYGSLDSLGQVASKFVSTKWPNGFGKNADDSTGTDSPGGLGITYSKYYYPDGSPRFDSLGRPLPSAMSSQSTRGGSDFTSPQ